MDAGFVKSWIDNDQERVWTGMHGGSDFHLKYNRDPEGRTAVSCLVETLAHRKAPLGLPQQMAIQAHSRW